MSQSVEAILLNIHCLGFVFFIPFVEMRDSEAFWCDSVFYTWKQTS